MSILIIFSTLISVIILTAYLYIKYAFSFWKRRGVPFAEPSFPFGNFRKLFLQQQSLAELVVDLYNSSMEQVLGVFITIQPSLIVRDPKILRDIFIKDFSSFYHRGTNTNENIDPMTNNLLLQNGEKWKQNRSKLTPAFSSGKLKGMFDTIVDCGSSLHRYFEPFAESGEMVEIRDICARYATNVIASVAFGIDIDCIKNPNDDFRLFGQRFFEPTPKNMFRFHLTFIYPKLAELLRLRFADKDVGDFMTETVRQNLEYRENNNVTRKDFFQLLMQLRNTGSVQSDDDWSTQSSNKKLMSLEEMSAHSFVFYTASFESTSTTMSFCIHELAKNHDLQAIAHHEIDTVMHKYHGKLTYESMAEMKFVESCIDETLRLHPPFGTVSRQCTNDYKIGGDSGIVIEKGTSIIIPVAAIHRDAKYFDRANEFVPSRFNDENVAGKTFMQMPYLPFGDGPRICIGLRLAKLQIKIGIVLLLEKFRFELGAPNMRHELKLDPRSIAKLPVGGINLKVISRYTTFSNSNQQS